MSVAKAVCGAVSIRLLILPRRRPAAPRKPWWGSSRVARGPDGKTGRPRILGGTSRVGAVASAPRRAGAGGEPGPRRRGSASEAEPVAELGPCGGGPPAGFRGRVAPANPPRRLVG